MTQDSKAQEESSPSAWDGAKRAGSQEERPSHTSPPPPSNPVLQGILSRCPEGDHSQAGPRPRWPAPVKLSVPWHKGAYIPAQPRSGVFSGCWCDECEPRTGGWGLPDL